MKRGYIAHMDKKFFIILLLALLPNTLLAGLFVGVAIVKKGLVVLEPAESGQGPGRVKERVRVELGDVIRVGADGHCELLVYEGTVAHLPPNSDYRVKRQGIYKMLDGGNVLVVPFRLQLGQKTQRQPMPKEPSALGTITPRGRVFIKRCNSDTWAPMVGQQKFFPGDVVRCDKGVEAGIDYIEGPKIRLAAGTLAYLLPLSISIERGGGFVVLPAKRMNFFFAASMTSLRPRGVGTVFNVMEDKDGCYLHVFKGSVKMALKAQGLPSRATVRAGLKSRLTRAGTIDRPESFVAKDRLAGLVTKISSALENDGPLTLDELFKASPIAKAPNFTPPPTVAPPPPTVKPVTRPPIAKPPATSKPRATLKPTGPMPGQDLEDLFQLPRLGSGPKRP